ncbi:MAG: hypothetical protein ACJ761_03995 [Chloroflexota bacterium]
MRRASFHVGLVVLGLVTPAVLVAWGAEVHAFEVGPERVALALEGAAGFSYAMLGLLAVAGTLVALVESRAVAASILGGYVAGRPVTLRQALQRSRMVFWHVVAAAFLAAIPAVFAQAAVNALLRSESIATPDVTLVATLLAGTVAQAPFIYGLSGVVLGDVGAFEAIRRSVTVFRARKLGAVVISLFDTVSQALVFLGLVSGLDLVIRAFGAVGLGLDAGPVGIAIATFVIVVLVFAFGTLLYTVSALAIAPQVVMFVSLTHATIGLDRVRAGGSHDPSAPDSPGRPRFRWMTRTMLLAFVAGALMLASALAAVLRA